MFHGWDNYFFMVGSAAASLIGLLFVVVTLTQGRERTAAMRGARIYMTPLAIHFAAVLVDSAVCVVPNLSTEMAAVIFLICALVGLVNALQTCFGIRGLATKADPPHWSDIWWYGLTPATVHIALIVISAGFWFGASWAVPAIAATLMVLLLAGIRNAWDLVTWIAPGSGAALPPVDQP